MKDTALVIWIFLIIIFSAIVGLTSSGPSDDANPISYRGMPVDE